MSRIKMSRTITFWSDCEIKIPRNVVFRLKSEIQKLFKKHEIKMPRKFVA